MSSPLQPCKHSEAGSTIVLVLTGILLISLIAAGLLASQKSLSSSSQKIEQVEVLQDVADLCLKNAIRHLKNLKSVTNPQPSGPVTITEPPGNFGSWIIDTIMGSYDRAARFNAYTQAKLSKCRYDYVKSRPITGAIIGGQLTRSRSYVSQQATEKIYLINAVVCTDSACSGVKTETNFYIGVQ